MRRAAMNLSRRDFLRSGFARALGETARAARPGPAAPLWIEEERCFSAAGHGRCDVCVERCPVRPKPIAVRFGSAPRVDPARCTGCGICAGFCPAQALALLPPAPAAAASGPDAPAA
ncbi:MAG: 4Fe-4S binding protein [Planctomycetota bacterium]